MTVREFIEKLRDLPPDALVCVAELQEAFAANVSDVERLEDTRIDSRDADGRERSSFRTAATGWWSSAGRPRRVRAACRSGHGPASLYGSKLDVSFRCPDRRYAASLPHGRAPPLGPAVHQCHMSGTSLTGAQP